MAMVTSCKQQQQHLLIMEVKVLSARCLKGRSSLLFGRLRPYVVLSVVATSDVMRESDDLPTLPTTLADAARLYRTRVDELGSENPTWGDTVRLPLNPSFFHPAPAGSNTPVVHLLVLSKRRLLGPARLGWCQIAACDVVDGLRSPCSTRRLSYALRSCRHGGRGHGVIDVAVRLVEPVTSPVPLPATSQVVVPRREVPQVQVFAVPPAPRWVGDVVIGIPVRTFRPAPNATVGMSRKLQGRGLGAGLTWR